MKPNRYIKAMEIGLAHEKEGISYFDLVYELHGTKEKVFSKEAEFTFCNWFLENFDAIDGEVWPVLVNKSELFQKFLQHNERGGTYHNKGVDRKMYNFLDAPFFLKGNAAKQYLDYQELVESRKAATQAKKQSNISIGIAIFALLVSSVLGIYSMGTAPKPPYDVKVIENNTSTQQLEMENDNLREELYKAEMMLEAYESDLDSVSVSGS